MLYGIIWKGYILISSGIGLEQMYKSKLVGLGFSQYRAPLVVNFYTLYSSCIDSTLFSITQYYIIVH